MILPSLGQIPSDNLYKARAMFGLVVMVAGLLFSGSLWWQERIAIEQASVEMAQVEHAALDAKQAVDALKSIGDTNANAAAIVPAFRRADSLVAEAHNANNEVRLLAEAAKGRSERISRAGVAGLVVASFGAGLALVAFRHWYERHQKHQDALLIAETVDAVTNEQLEHGAASGREG